MTCFRSDVAYTKVSVVPVPTWLRDLYKSAIILNR